MEKSVDMIVTIFSLVAGFTVCLYLVGLFLKLIPVKLALQILIPIILYVTMMAYSAYLPRWLFAIGILAFMVWFIAFAVKIKCWKATD